MPRNISETNQRNIVLMLQLIHIYNQIKEAFHNRLETHPDVLSLESLFYLNINYLAIRIMPRLRDSSQRTYMSIDDQVVPNTAENRLNLTQFDTVPDVMNELTNTDDMMPSVLERNIRVSDYIRFNEMLSFLNDIASYVNSQNMHSTLVTLIYNLCTNRDTFNNYTSELERFGYLDSYLIPTYEDLNTFFMSLSNFYQMFLIQNPNVRNPNNAFIYLFERAKNSTVQQYRQS